jgi:cytoskeletal protein RodZ
MNFVRRPLAGPDTLGERLRQLRIESRQTPEQVAKAIHVAVKYVVAIEENRYKDIPGLVYARNFVRLYVRYMKLPVESAMERFEKEWQVIQGRRTERAGMVQRAHTEPRWWQRHAGLVIAGVVVAVVIGYFGWQLVRFFQPPSLVVTNPADDVSTNSATIIIRGKSVSEAIVSVNNEQVEIQPDGTFSDEVTLQPGLNVLKITSQRKRSRTATIVRRILFETTDSGEAPGNTSQTNVNTVK